jgi:hypothetical protein
MWEQPKRLYAAEFKTGVIKIGVTGLAGDRRGQLLRQHHGQVVRIHYGEKHECGFWAEHQLIARMRRIANTVKGREWFADVRFGAARQLVDQVTRMAHVLAANKAEAA